MAEHRTQSVWIYSDRKDINIGLTETFFTDRNGWRCSSERGLNSQVLPPSSLFTPSVLPVMCVPLLFPLVKVSYTVLPFVRLQ